MSYKRKVLLLMDKLGVTPAYQPIWTRLVKRAGFEPSDILRVNLHNKHAGLLKKVRTRKTPSFSPDKTLIISKDVLALVKQHQVEFIICQDSACLCLIDSDTETATIDNHRGGIYTFAKTPFFVTLPISAVNRMQSRDIQILNDGVSSKAEWLEQNREGLFIEPYSIKLGTWILEQDLKKAHRLWSNI